MSKFYTVEECWNKADQHSELASLAFADGDREDGLHHHKMDLLWQDRAKQGGWQSDE